MGFGMPAWWKVLSYQEWLDHRRIRHREEVEARKWTGHDRRAHRLTLSTHQTSEQEAGRRIHTGGCRNIWWRTMAYLVR